MCSDHLEVTDYAGKQLSQDEINHRIEELRILIKGNDKLDKLRSDDSYLLRFLHYTKFDVEAAYAKVLAFYEFLNDQKEWVALNPPEEMKKFLDMNVTFVLSDTDKNGKRLVLTRVEPLNPAKISLAELSRIDDLWMESVLDDPLVQAKGLSVVVDVSGLSWRHFRWITPSNIKKGLRRVDNVIIKEITIHVVRTSALVNTALKIVMPFFPPENKDQLIFHFNDFNSLHQHIDPQYLPKEYGGTRDINFEVLNKTLLEQNSDLAEKLKHYRSICVEDINCDM